MKRLAALLAFTSVLAACGGTVEEETAPPTAQRSQPLAQLALGARPQPYELPGGLHAADRRSYYALVDTELRRVSTLTGKVTRTYTIEGDWELSGVSATGKWVALQRPGTEILVLDTTTAGWRPGSPANAGCPGIRPGN